MNGSSANLVKWREDIVTLLKDAGPTCRHAAQVIVERGAPVGFAKQPRSGAKWTLRGEIQLSTETYSIPEINARLLGAVVHEATHLEQGLLLRLSVEGEVRGWAAEFQARQELEKAGLGPAISDPHWQNIASLPAFPADRQLRYARSEMLAYDPRYLIWLLPLRPGRWPLALLIPFGPLFAYYGVP